MALLQLETHGCPIKMKWKHLIIIFLISTFMISTVALGSETSSETQTITKFSSGNYQRVLQNDCNTGQFEDSNGTCTACNSNCKTCSNTATNCLSCTNKILNSSNQCQVCPLGQGIVNNACVPCSSFQFVNQNVLCQNCAIGCTACSLNSQNCTACEPNTYIYSSSTNTCTPCAGQCLTCQGSVDNCTNSGTLDSNFVGSCKFNGNTLICEINCIQCACDQTTGDTTCQVALDGHAINGSGKVVRCSDGCSKCAAATPGNCQRCFESYTLTSQSQCVICDQSCFSCKNATTCVSCRSGNFINATGLCSPCTVQNCLACSSSTECSLCKDGFLVVKDTKRCAECLPTCGICDQEDILKCKGCWDGFFLNGTTNCVACPVGCSTCLNQNVCISCITGFVLGTQNTQRCFRDCVFPCVSCIDGQPTTCLSCSAGYKFQSNTCTPDISCNATSQCAFCPLGFAKVGGNCQTCSVANCGQCQRVNQATCDACNKGYFLQANGCELCPTGCSSCISKQKCYSCSEGYTFTQSQNGNSQSPLCYKCDQSCASCGSLITQCILCATGYTKIGRKCVSDNAVEYSLTLDYNGNVQTFVSQQKYAEAVRDILLSLGISKEDANTLTGIEQGSIILKGRIDATATDQCNQFADLSSNLAQGGSIGGFTILSTSLSASNPVCENVNSSSTVTIILAVALSLLGLLIIALIVALIVRKAQGDDQYEPELAPGEENKDTNKYQAQNTDEV